MYVPDNVTNNQKKSLKLKRWTSLPDYEEYQHDHKRSHRRYVLVGKLQDDPNIKKQKKTLYNMQYTR